jgi:putative SOS response-associated peptidase YedK
MTDRGRDDRLGPANLAAMCNLYRNRSQENVARLFDARPLQGELPQLRTDIYPKYEAIVVRKDESGERMLDVMPWGIITTIKGKSGKPIKKPVTNVRNLSSHFWRSSLSNPMQHCIVPFTEFAEPRPGRDENGRPAQWWFTIPMEEVSAFAGIWRFSDDRPRFAFLTCEPNPLVAPLHPKAMPVILSPDDYDGWLDGTYDDACALAQPFPSQLMTVA